MTGCSAKDTKPKETDNKKEEVKNQEVTKASKEVKELFSYFDATLKTQGLHLQAQYDEETEEAYYAKKTEIKKNGSGRRVIVTGNIDNADPKKPHYLMKQEDEDSTIVYGEENGNIYTYMKQEDGTYALQQKDKVTNAKEDNSFVYHYLTYDLLKLTNACFTCQKEEEGKELVYTLQIKDKDAYIKLYNKKNKELQEINADISKLHSYKIVFRIKEGIIKSVTSDIDYESSIPQSEENEEYDTYVKHVKSHLYSDFTRVNEKVVINVAGFKG